MIADDEKDNRALASRILRKDGYKVITAKSGTECLRKLKKQKPHLVLMDVMMPGPPVKEVIAKIKRVPILYFTIVQMSSKEKKELRHGNVRGFVKKPISDKALLAKVKKALKG